MSGKKIKIEMEGIRDNLVYCREDRDTNEIVCEIDESKLPIRVILPQDVFDDINDKLSKHDKNTTMAVIRQLEKIVKIYGSIGD